MLGQNKRGAMPGGLKLAFTIVFGFIIVGSGIFMILGLIEGQTLVDATEKGLLDFGGLITRVIQPLFESILRLDQIPGDYAALAILTFILAVFSFAAIFDSLPFFTDVHMKGPLNFLIAFILGVIGVRYMPPEMWPALTAPTSGAVALIPIGGGFIIAAGLTNWLFKASWAKKLVWIFYVVFISFVFFNATEGGQFTWMFIIFVILAILMAFFDKTIQGFLRRQQHEAGLERLGGHIDAQHRQKIRKQIKKWTDVLNDENADPNDPSYQKDRKTAMDQIEALKKKYGSEALDAASQP